MRRSVAVCALAGVLFVGCGLPADEAAPAATNGIERPNLEPTSTTEVATTVPDRWLEAVMAARYPLAVAYGLPDDDEAAARLLLRSYERKKARCMQRLGFQYEPWLDFDPSVDRKNKDWINQQPLEDRKAYAAAMPQCSDEANRLTYLAAAVGESAVPGATPPDLPPREISDAERRKSDIAFVVEHRDVLERLVSNLEVE